MNHPRRTRSRWLKFGLTAMSLLATLGGWKAFAGMGAEANLAAQPSPPPAQTPVADSAEPVRMAIVTTSDGQTYLIPLQMDDPSAPAAPAPIARTQSSR